MCLQQSDIVAIVEHILQPCINKLASFPGSNRAWINRKLGGAWVNKQSLWEVGWCSWWTLDKQIFILHKLKSKLQPKSIQSKLQV